MRRFRLLFLDVLLLACAGIAIAEWVPFLDPKDPTGHLSKDDLSGTPFARKLQELKGQAIQRRRELQQQRQHRQTTTEETVDTGDRTLGFRTAPGYGRDTSPDGYGNDHEPGYRPIISKRSSPEYDERSPDYDDSSRPYHGYDSEDSYRRSTRYSSSSSSSSSSESYRYSKKSKKSKKSKGSKSSKYGGYSSSSSSSSDSYDSDSSHRRPDYYPGHSSPDYHPGYSSPDYHPGYSSPDYPTYPGYPSPDYPGYPSPDYPTPGYPSPYPPATSPDECDYPPCGDYPHPAPTPDYEETNLEFVLERYYVGANVDEYNFGLGSAIGINGEVFEVIYYDNGEKGKGDTSIGVFKTFCIVTSTINDEMLCKFEIALYTVGYNGFGAIIATGPVSGAQSVNVVTAAEYDFERYNGGTMTTLADANNPYLFAYLDLLNHH